MGLNIKKPATEAAIRRLAARTGESLTTAIERAVTERLAKLDAEQARPTLEDYLARIKPLQDEFEEYRRKTGDTRNVEQIMKDFDAEFYDDVGAPK